MALVTLRNAVNIFESIVAFSGSITLLSTTTVRIEDGSGYGYEFFGNFTFNEDFTLGAASVNRIRVFDEAGILADIDEIGYVDLPLAEAITNNSYQAVFASALLGADTVFASDQSDRISTRGGNDVLYAGGGADRFSVGSGNDTVYGGPGTDTSVFVTLSADARFRLSGDLLYLDSPDGNDLYHDVEFFEFLDRTVSLQDLIYQATAGDDVLQGSALSEHRDAEGGDDLVFGLAGHDTLLGGLGADTLYAGDGEDLVDGQDGDDLLGGGRSSDTLLGGDGTDSIWGAAGLDLLEGGSGDDLMGGGADADTILGGAGNDEIWGGSGGDRIIGSTGADTIGGSLGDDYVQGDQGADELWGGDGNDTLLGIGDNDTVGGGNGNDFIEGNAGNDLLYGGGGNDRLLGGADADVLYGGGGADTIDGGGGNDTIYAGAGADVIVFSTGGDWVHDFSLTQDAVDLTSFISVENFAQLRAGYLGASGANAVIVDGNDNALLLIGVNVDSLTADNFIF